MKHSKNAESKIIFENLLTVYMIYFIIISTISLVNKLIIEKAVIVMDDRQNKEEQDEIYRRILAVQ